MAKDYSTGLALVTLRTAERFAREFNFTLDTAFVAPQLTEPSNRYPTGGSGGIRQGHAGAGDLACRGQ